MFSNGGGSFERFGFGQHEYNDYHGGPDWEGYSDKSAAAEKREQQVPPLYRC